jgi:hypothetical protein
MNGPFRTEKRLRRFSTQAFGLGFKNRPFRTENQNGASRGRESPDSVLARVRIVPGSPQHYFCPVVFNLFFADDANLFFGKRFNSSFNTLPPNSPMMPA